MNNPIRLSNAKFICLFFGAWLLWLYLAPAKIVELIDYALFSLLGIIGAIFANATGAGGGVVFIPMFKELGFTDTQSVATSFAIQCFGMTAGAITWWNHYQTEKTDLRLWQGFKRIIVITSIAAIVGIGAVQGFNIASPSSLHHSFSWFSLILGWAIILTVYAIKPKRERSQIQWFDWLALSVIGLSGGAITAWLSVGVGELLAVYLILRRFDISLAVSAAVIVSAITVWTGIWHYTLVNFQVYWQVVLFAGPGAIIGGILAKTLVTHLSATKLKIFFAFWLVVIGLVGLEL